MNWRRKKREWKKRVAPLTPRRKFTRYNGSDRAIRTMFQLTGLLRFKFRYWRYMKNG